MMNHSKDQAENDPMRQPSARSRTVLLPTLKSRTLTKAELTDLLFDRLGLNKREAKEMVEAFFDQIKITLVKENKVKLSGFGSFSVRHKSARPGRNPRTGESVPIQARSVVTFQSSQKLKAIAQSHPSFHDDPGA